MNGRIVGEKSGVERDVVLSQGLFLAVVFGFFFSLGHYVLVFQESQSLFIYSGEYLRRFLSEPGGLLTYAGTFLSQFFAGKVLGPCIVAVILTLPATLLYFLNRRLRPTTRSSWLFLLLPSCALFIMQANLYHKVEYDLGFLLVLFLYLLVISSRKTSHRILVLCFIPLFYVLAGAYATVLVGLLVVHTIFFEKGKRRLVFIPFLLVITIISFLLLRKILFLQSATEILFSPFPFFENPAYNVSLVFLTGFMVFLPFLLDIFSRVLPERFNKRVYSLPSKVILLFVALWLVFVEYNPEIRRVVELEELVYAEEWDEAIEFQERTQSGFRVGQYLYNIALSETGQLCDRMFSSRQDFGPGSLYLPLAVENLNNGGLFFYAIGLTNEAQRWAYEDMITIGYRPRNLKMLAKTSLLNGDYRVARKYLDLLKEDPFYRDWAEDFDEMADDPSLIASHSELAAKLEILPRTNFFVEYNEPDLNLALLLQGQPDNRKALEYSLAEALLNRNVRIAVSGIRGMKEAGYSRIPRHLEEAAMIQISLSDVPPDLGGLTISDETRAGFERFSAAYASGLSDPSAIREQMRTEFGDTYWFYFYFS